MQSALVDGRRALRLSEKQPQRLSHQVSGSASLYATKPLYSRASSGAAGATLAVIQALRRIHCGTREGCSRGNLD